MVRSVKCHLPAREMQLLCKEHCWSAAEVVYLEYPEFWERPS